MEAGTVKNLVIGVARVAVVLVALGISGFWIDGMLGVFHAASVELTIVGIFLVGGGLALEALGTRTFWKSGHGIPNPIDPPQTLVIVGPYRYSRNPLYMARLMILFGAAAILRSPGIALLAVALFLGLQFLLIPREERRLVGRFGLVYEEYRGRVDRWIPLPTRRRHTDKTGRRGA